MALVLVASLALGFCAASILSVFWLLAVVLPSALVVTIVSAVQGTPLLHAAGLGAGAFAVAQVGYGLGLVWVAVVEKPSTSD